MNRLQVLGLRVGQRPNATVPASSRKSSKSSWRRRLLRSGLVLLLLAAAGETLARWRLGLGDPPLSVSDPQVEYLFKPSSVYHRFGNTISYNSYSMRSKEMPVRKSNPRELRILVMGDSVVNGGALSDQKNIATELLEKRLNERLEPPVKVGNISAGSWGPPNMLAYARKFGLFQADVIAIVLSSHDASDAPTFAPIVGVDPDFPNRRPYLAIQEAAERYLPRYIPPLRRAVPAAAPLSPSEQKRDTRA